MSCQPYGGGGAVGGSGPDVAQRLSGWTGQFVSEVADLYPDTEAVVAAFAFQDLSSDFPWWLRAWGKFLTTETDGAAVVGSASYDEILNQGEPTIPYKLKVTPDGGASPDSFFVDVGTGCTIMLPPSKAVRVDVVGPASLQRVAPGGPQIPFPIGTDLFNCVLSLSLAAQQCTVAQVRRNRLTRTITVAAAVSEFVPIPEHARFLWAYVSQAGGVGTPVGVRFWYRSAVVERYLGIADFNAGPQMIPGGANQVEVLGAALAETGASLVFELEV